MTKEKDFDEIEIPRSLTDSAIDDDYWNLDDDD